MKLKPLDFGILSELMKNAKMSDREVAKRLGVSQPTVTRRRKGLEKAGIVKEYTVIPDFPRVGYHIMAITLLKYSRHVAEDEEKRGEARKRAYEIVERSPCEMVMAESGMGIGYDGMTVSFHTDYRAYVQFKNWMRQALPLSATKMESFLVDLSGQIHYRPLTFTTLAKHLLTLTEK
jgi:DNA-binding Lrp family transcriptional regulator